MSESKLKAKRQPVEEVGPEELIGSIGGGGGLFFINILHDPWCKTLKTGNGGDCNCNPETQFLKAGGER